MLPAANRRKFLGLALGAGAAGLAVGQPWAWSDATRPAGMHCAARAARAFASDISLTVFHEDPAVAERAATAAMAELSLVEDLMSLYRPQSALSRLNRAGVLEKPHPYLVQVLAEAESVSRASRGAFDVTVQPLWDLYAAHARNRRLPEPDAVEAARHKVDWRRVEVAPHRIRVHDQGTAITLNGIAQGFAADRAVEALRRHGICHALVNAGEIGSLGGKPGGQAWNVGIQHARRPDAYAALARLEGRSLSTSGDYATTFTDDYRLHHIFDPRTGCSPSAFASVSVVAASACHADALSTAVFVCGAEAGLALVRATPNADALLIFKDGRRLATEGFPLAST